MNKKLITIGLTTTLLTLTGCSGFYLTAGSGKGIKQHYRGVAGIATVSKAKNDSDVVEGYWASQIEEIKQLMTWNTNEEQGS